MILDDDLSYVVVCFVMCNFSSALVLSEKLKHWSLNPRVGVLFFVPYFSAETSKLRSVGLLLFSVNGHLVVKGSGILVGFCQLKASLVEHRKRPQHPFDSLWW